MEILTRLRTQLHAKGTQQLCDLESYFHQMDQQNTGRLGRKETETCLNYFGLFPTSQELGTLLRVYGTTEGITSYLNWKEFILALGDKLSKSRENALRIAYDSICCHGLSVPELTQYGRFEKHPLAQRGILPADELRREFHRGLSKIQADANNAVTWESFKEYYTSVSLAFPIDDDFVAMLVGVWNATALQKTRVTPIFGGKKAAFIEKLEQRTHKEENTRDVLLRAFRKQDMSETGFVTQAEFQKTCQVLGMILTEDEIKETFKSGQTNAQGRLCVSWFIDFICE